MKKCMNVESIIYQLKHRYTAKFLSALNICCLTLTLTACGSSTPMSNEGSKQMETNLVSNLSPTTSVRVTVLAYHHLLTTKDKYKYKIWKNDDMVMTVDQFASEMQYLHDHNYHVLTLSQLESYIKGDSTAPQHSVVLTFDDGYKSDFLYASPILRKYGYKATMFAIVGNIKSSPQPWDASKLQFISWPEIKKNADVFDVESHTFALHYSIKGRAALVVKPTSQVYNDLAKAKKLLNAKYFAYPYGTPGSYNIQTIKLLKQAGYQMAVTTTKGYAVKGTPLFQIPRFLLAPRMSIQSFQTIVTGMYHPYIRKIKKPSLLIPSFALIKSKLP